MKKDYTIALDIGTNSVGYAVVYDDFSIPKKKMKVLGNTNKKYVKKNFIGSVLFEAGETAADRRGKRNARRRQRRRKQRLNELQSIFSEAMMQVDAAFFHRLEDSFIVPEDKKHEKHPIFGNFEQEQAYHEKFPTIYHLRKKLVDNPEQADLRLIYLALAHMIKYRGNFLIDGKIDFERLSLDQVFQEFLQCYNETFDVWITEDEIHAVDDTISADAILKEEVSKSIKVKNILALFPNEKSNQLFAQFLKLMMGNKADFKKYFKAEDEKDLKITLATDEFESDLDNLIAIIGEQYREIFYKVKNVYNAILLADIINGNDLNSQAILSANMVARYEQHQQDLKHVKEFVQTYLPDKYYRIFRDRQSDSYASYIEGKTKQAGAKVISQEELYKALTKELSDCPQIKDYDFLEKMDKGTFLLKQRSFANVVLPHQIHLHEMLHILEHQMQYYPFLKEQKDKIVQLLTFRIPYYIGPLAKGQSEFAWLVRNSDEKIKPWNIEEVVDYKASAENFITRMILNDTYLPGEKVLPRASLIYQKYTVFNELTKLKIVIDGKEQAISTQEKQQLFEELFKFKQRVTVKDIKNRLAMGYSDKEIKIEGVKDKFNAHYQTYITLAKNKEIKQLLDDDNHSDMIEDIIKKLTLFEDKKMRKAQLHQYKDILSDQAIKFLVKQRFTGWGRLSKKLLVGLRDQHSHQTILDYLVDDPKNRNFMQLIKDSTLSFEDEIFKYQQQQVAHSNMAEVVRELPGNPAIKKGILQSLKIVQELVAIMGYKPKNIVVEMARENQNTSQSASRRKKIEKALKELDDSEIVKIEKNQNLDREKVYLYYLQNGKDMYTDNPLDISRLEQYHVDHIIAQSEIKDDSIDNKVLTSAIDNAEKSKGLVTGKIQKKMTSYWQRLHKAGLVSDKKYSHLTKKELTEEDRARFTQRQLVETRQITKHVANILHQQFNTDTELSTKIITLKSSMVSDFRQRFNIYKLRYLNDYHHAHDAYLSAVVALLLLRVHPKVEKSLVYGQFKYVTYKKDVGKATQRKEFYENILKFLEEDPKTNEETGEILCDASWVAGIKRQIFEHPVNIVKKTEINKGQLYNDTLLPKAPKGKLIAQKNHLDTTKYGGFTSLKVASTVFVQYQTSSKIIQKLMSIPIVDLKLFKENPYEYLSEQVQGTLLSYKLLPKYTLVELANGHRRYVISDNEMHKAQQFRLDAHLIQLLYHANRMDDDAKSKDYIKDHLADFDIILNHICTFATTNDIINIKDLEKLQQAYNGIVELTEIAKSFVEIFKLVQARAAADFKFFTFKSNRCDRGYVNSDAKLVPQGKVIHQSITGLYETHIDLRQI